MSSFLRMLVAICLTAVVVLVPVWSDGGLGDDLGDGGGSGGNGWGNLPGGHKTGAGVGGLEFGGPRLTLTFADLRLGVNLRLSPEMRGAMARVSAPGLGAIVFAANGRDLVLDGDVLATLHDAGVDRLDFDIVSLDGHFLPVSLRFAADHSVEVLVY